MAASSCSARSCVRVFSKTSDLNGSRWRAPSHQGWSRTCPGSLQLVASRTVPGSVEVRPVQGRRELTRFIKLPFRLHQGTPWVPPLIFERRQFLEQGEEPATSTTPRPSTSSPGGTVEPVGRITAQVDRRWDEFQGGSDGQFGFIEAEDDPEVFEALLGDRRGLGPAARARAADRPDGLHDQRRVRAADRGLRPRSDDPRAVASALLPGAARGARLRQDAWTC